MAVGVAPTTAVEGKGIVGELDWLETISDNGTAVGLVDLKVTVIDGVVAEGAEVVPATVPVPVGVGVGIGGGGGAEVPVAVPEAGAVLEVAGVPGALATEDDALGGAWRASTRRTWRAASLSAWAATSAGRTTRTTAV